MEKQSSWLTYPYMRSISDEKLLRIYQSVKPIATYGEKKYTLKNFTLEELRSKELKWNSEENKRILIKNNQIKIIDDFLCLHSNEHLASLVDIISQIPNYIISEVNAFEIIEPPEKREHLLVHSRNLHLSKIRTYKITK